MLRGTYFGVRAVPDTQDPGTTKTPKKEPPAPSQEADGRHHDQEILPSLQGPSTVLDASIGHLLYGVVLQSDGQLGPSSSCLGIAT